MHRSSKASKVDHDVSLERPLPAGILTDSPHVVNTSGAWLLKLLVFLPTGLPAVDSVEDNSGGASGDPRPRTSSFLSEHLPFSFVFFFPLIQTSITEGFCGDQVSATINADQCNANKSWVIGPFACRHRRNLHYFGSRMNHLNMALRPGVATREYSDERRPHPTIDPLMSAFVLFRATAAGPQELLDAIVACVRDTETLLACALPSRSLVNATIPQHRGITARWAPLESILATATRVKQLATEGGIRVGTKSQLRVNPSLSGVIQFLSLKSLRCISLANLSDVPSCIVMLALETFEEVCLLGIVIVRDDEPASTPLTSKSLRHLDTGHSIASEQAGIISFLVQPRQLGYLQSVTHLSFVYGGSGPLTDLLAACAPTLESLEINYRQPFALPPLPALKHLELRLFSTRGAVYFIAIPFVLCTLRGSPHCEKLTVAFRERDGDHIFNWDDAGLSFCREWLAPDNMLSETYTQRQGDGFSDDEDQKLFEVHFSLRVSRDEPERGLCV
ncbi:hypothetical protein C8R45DRAFT_1077539 [Mycena sanguinolenta]|nr:hypothetical protein C8R45DRAFT_1077539 [Mycena sanguinolenta]